MTGTSDVPQNENEKILKDPKQLDATNEFANQQAESNRYETATANSNAEFGAQRSAPITWNNVVYGNSQDTEVTEQSALQAYCFTSEVEGFVQTLKEHGITSLIWQRSLADSSDNDEYDAKDSDTTDGTVNYPRFSSNTTNQITPIVSGAVKPFLPTQKRFILGSEIALAVVIAAAGATRLRAGIQKSRPRAELIPGDNTANSNQTAEVQLQQSKVTATPIDTVSATETDRTSVEERPEQERPAKKQPTVRPKTLVASTDTLVSIAEAFFYDRNVAWLIADINQPILKETWMNGKRVIELKSRQQIELPLKDEIEGFYTSKPEHARPENLVTIVDETSVDVELLNSSLAHFFDSNQD